MKKTLFLTLLLVNITAYCAEQNPNPVNILLNKIELDVQATPPAAYEKLEDFLKSDQALQFKDKIIPLSLQEKNRLMFSIQKRLSPETFIPSLENWPAKRDFLALIILSGGSIDAGLNLSYTLTFLDSAVFLNDIQGVKFALAHGANAAHKSLQNLYTLELSSNYEIAQLLIDHGAFKPFETDSAQLSSLLELAMTSAVSSKLLNLYAQKIPLNGIDQKGNTLLMELCKWAYLHTSEQFFQKFQILFKAGAVNPTTKNKFGETALDIVNNLDQNNKTVQLAKGLLIDLKNLPHIVESKLSSIEQTKAIQEKWQKES